MRGRLPGPPPSARPGSLSPVPPASLSHFSRRGLSLHMFLKLRLRASKREMVVWLKSLP